MKRPYRVGGNQEGKSPGCRLRKFRWRCQMTRTQKIRMPSRNFLAKTWQFFGSQSAGMEHSYFKSFLGVLRWPAPAVAAAGAQDSAACRSWAARCQMNAWRIRASNTVLGQRQGCCSFMSTAVVLSREGDVKKGSALWNTNSDLGKLM